jgi:hypothetical protein
MRGTTATYVVQSASALTKLDDLDCGIEAVQALVVETAVTRGFQTCFEIRATGFLHAC